MQQTLLGLLDRGWSVHVVSRICDIEPRPGLTWTRVPTPRAPFAIAYPLFAVVAGIVLLATDRRGHRVALGAIVFNRVAVITVQFCHAGFAARGVVRRARGRLRRLHEAVSVWQANILERWCYQGSRLQRMTAVSEVVKNELLAHYDLASVPIEVIPNGVDAQRFRPGSTAERAAERERLGLVEGELCAVFVGGDWHRKGLAIAIEAAAMARWTLLVIGGGDVEFWSGRAAGAGAKVLFRGHISTPERVMRAADAFLLPSAYEGFALVTLEAAATELPLLVTEATGASGLVRASGGEPLARDAATFAAALTRLGSDAELRAQRGRAARAASEELTWPKIVPRYACAYAPTAARAS